MAKAIQEELIRYLSGGQFVSGQWLGEQLGVSRAAISNHIASLVDMGLDIYSVTGKGYKLSEPLTLLDENNIQRKLLELGQKNKVEVHNIIDSTNSYLLRRLPNQNHNLQVCLAEYQNSGRGRRGRKWISPFGSHIYMSMYWFLEQGMAAAMGLSVVSALAVSDAIKDLYQIDVQLKWPNDIYFDGVKLAGILIDLEGQALEPCHCVIGIGLNINMPQKSAEQVDQPWTDLQEVINKSITNSEDKKVDFIDRDELAATLITKLSLRLQQHQSEGLATMVNEWAKHDFYFNKPVKLITGTREKKGICRGINSQGALLLEVEGKISPVYGGEVSLRGE
ncbi:MAG: bifunctional biotin--[acetyl-CoA-carboxylase] ligase/biotin operon repressor BirA [Colwellia sp.]|nr:bifunctional biotin--[acetyl-CoA-carboxylase] ligase/biotin operon repressor BirA [Colwellia sp.]